MRFAHAECVFLAALALITAGPVRADANSERAASASASLDAGEKLSAHGRYAEAVKQFANAERLYAQVGDVPKRITALQHLANAKESIGDPNSAIADIEQALTLARAANQQGLTTVLTAQLGGAYARMGRIPSARPLLESARAAAERNGDDVLLAAVLNDIGTVYRLEHTLPQAREAFLEAGRLAEKVGHPRQAMRARLNAANIALELGAYGEANRLAATAHANIEPLEASYGKALELLWCGQTFVEVARHDAVSREQSLASAYASLQSALRIASDLQDNHLLSAVRGSLGSLYRLTGRNRDALTLTEQAIRGAQSVGAADLLFYWHWQEARILRGMGNHIDQAIDAYRHAYAVHQGRGMNQASSADLLRVTEPPTTEFLELADLLLQRSATVRDPRAYLLEARNVVEALKARELQDYFRDSCVAEARTRAQSLDQTIDPTTAVLYPIVLPQRLELLLSHGSDITRVTVSVPAATVLDTARAFRVELERQRTLRYLPYAKQLYDWLIRPIETTLTAWKVTTLVTVPDYALRAIPMAALHDGQRFLVQRFAVAMVPGLELTDPRPLPRESTRTLLAGLTEPVQGFPALTYVRSELKYVHDYYPGRELVNENFRRDRLARELTGPYYAIAHIASHGEFLGNARESFVLAYDGKITMDELSRYIGYNRLRGDPVDLLTLSACYTAAGDDRASLGLAGIAVKAGARSVVAAFWPIHDEATALLMAEMYRQLRAGASKAVALQRAQEKLIGVTRYRHPGYWSAFVLIGNWL